MNPTLYLSILIVNGFLALIISAECFRHRENSNALKLFYLLLAISSWSFLQFLSIVITEPRAKLFVYHILFIGIIITPVTFFDFVFSYTSINIETKLSDFLSIIWIIPFINIVILLTNSFHHLFFSGHDYRAFGMYTQLFSKFNVFFWIHTTYAYFLTFLSIALLFYEYIANRRYFKKLILLLIAGSISPVIMNIIFLLDINSANYDFTPVSLLLSGLFFGYAVIRYQIYSGSPISKKLTLHSIKDCVLIVDDEGMIVEYNDSLEKEFALLTDYHYHTIQALPLMLRRILALTSKVEYYNHQIRVADEYSMIIYFKVKKIPVLEKNSLFFIYLLTNANTTTLLLQELEEKSEILENIKENKLRFLSSISHELRSPLNTIKDISVLLEERSSWSFAQKVKLSTIATQLHHKANLVLDYARIASKQLKSMSVNIPLSKIQEILAPDFCSFEDLAEEPQFIVAQNTFLSFLEHVHYGFDLIQESTFKKRHFFMTLSSFVAAVELTKNSAKDFYTIFSNEGPIDNYDTELRLHLSLIRSFLDLSQGKCTLTPENDNNCLLSFHVPIQLILKKNPPISEFRIDRMLLVDDSIITYFIFQKFANQFNINLDYAENLIDAQTHIDQQKTYQWILIDLHLGNLSGYEVVHQLKSELTIHTRFIAISSDQVNLTSDQMILSGFDQFLLKPIRAQDFENLILD